MLLGNLEQVDNIFVQEINKLCDDLKKQIQAMLEAGSYSGSGSDS